MAGPRRRGLRGRSTSSGLGLGIGGCTAGFGKLELKQTTSRRAHFGLEQVYYLQQAAHTALTHSAHSEAITHLTTALKLFKALPDALDRTQQELTLQTALGKALIAPKGYTAPEVRKVYTRARELCFRVGESDQLFPVLWGLFGIYMIGGELRKANDLGTEMLILARSVQNPALLLEAHHLLGHALYFLGEITSAREHFEQGAALYDLQQHHAHAILYGHDPGVTSWRMIRAADAKEVGVGNPAEETYRHPNQNLEESIGPHSKMSILLSRCMNLLHMQLVGVPSGLTWGADLVAYAS